MSEQSISILLIEPDKLEATRIQALLTSTTPTNLVQTTWVSTPTAGLRLMHQMSFNVIFIGLPLAGKIGDGLNILRTIRRIQPAIPIITVVGYDVIGLGLQSVELGAYTYFPRHQLTLAMMQQLVTGAVNKHRDWQKSYSQQALSEVAFNSLPVHVAVLDAAGVVTAVNSEWEINAFGETDPLIAQVSPGINFLTHARQNNAITVVRGLNAILSGQQHRFLHEYSHMHDDHLTWYILCITPMNWPVGGAIISRLDVTAAIAREIHLSTITQTDLVQLRSQVAIITHELRNPLTGMQLYLDLLARGKPEKQIQYLNILNQQVQHMEQFITDLLALARLQDGTHLPHQVKLDLNDLVQHVLLIQKPIAIEKGLTLIFNEETALPPMMGDARHMAQVITNLVANAIRYTPEGEVTITTAYMPTTNQISLIVQDTGIGIASEMISHIFDPFFRTPRARETADSGTGLGLSIVKQIVEQHGGNIEVTSDIGKGSTFTIRLPARSSNARR